MKWLVFLTAFVPGIALAQTVPHNSVTLSWTNPTTYTNGQALTIGQVTVFYDTTSVSLSGSTFPTAAAILTTPALAPGVHNFTVQVCDNSSPAICSGVSNTATVTVPATALAVPAVGNLTAVVNP